MHQSVAEDAAAVAGLLDHEVVLLPRKRHYEMACLLLDLVHEEVQLPASPVSRRQIVREWNKRS